MSVGRVFPQMEQPVHITLGSVSGTHEVTELSGGVWTGDGVAVAGSQLIGYLIRFRIELWKGGTLRILMISFLTNYTSC